uniref:Uncharacterized protein n=1 Tax=Salmonella sp. TaxID=599 RepID=A0A482EW20_SALSP|nr:hypothetical protein [Salmonella sp.]QBM91449.1 hypothetical protein NNIBIDOC_00120 [Salmonella sp.]
MRMGIITRLMIRSCVWQNSHVGIRKFPGSGEKRGPGGLQIYDGLREILFSIVGPSELLQMSGNG